MKKKLQICWNLPVSAAISSLDANHLDCNFNCYDFARINNCWVNLKAFQVISLFHTDFKPFKLRLCFSVGKMEMFVYMEDNKS